MAACILWFLLLFLSACGEDADVILQSAESEMRDTEANADAAAQADTETPAGQEDAVPLIWVYLCGAVNRPGVYEMEEGSRIWEAVELAGGLTEDADACGVNLAEPLLDGEMIRIPTVEETAAGVTYETGIYGTSGASGKLNINTAGAEELTSLNGIGDAKAAAIVAYREEHGPFQSIDEIMRVSGIGESTFDRIKEDITV